MSQNLISLDGSAPWDISLYSIKRGSIVQLAVKVAGQKPKALSFHASYIA